MLFIVGSLADSKAVRMELERILVLSFFETSEKYTKCKMWLSYKDPPLVNKTLVSHFSCGRVKAFEYTSFTSLLIIVVENSKLKNYGPPSKETMLGSP